VRVRDDGTVRVTIPRGGSKREAQEFAARQQAWIEKQLLRVDEARARPIESLGDDVFRGRAKEELAIRLLELAREHGIAV